MAEWAGHGVGVLLKVYAKCLDGQEDAARHRIEAALGQSSTARPERRPSDDQGDDDGEAPVPVPA